MIATVCTATADILTLDRVALNLTFRFVTIDGNAVALTAKEYAIVELLALRAGEVVTKADMMSHLYDSGSEPDAKILDVFVCKARRKLRVAGCDPIATVWGRGYSIAGNA